MATGSDGSDRLFVTRYNPQGSSDTSFGPDGSGVVRPPVGCNTAAGCATDTRGNAILVSSTTITIAGRAGASRLLTVRLQTNGSFDPSFRGVGWRMDAPGAGVVAAAGLDSAGDLYVSPTLYPVTEDFPAIYRYDPAGRVVASFGVSGVATAPACYQFPISVGSGVQSFPVFAGSPPDLRPVVVYACYERFD